MKKQVLSGLLCATMVTSLITGCTSAKQSEEAGTEESSAAETSQEVVNKSSKAESPVYYIADREMNKWYEDDHSREKLFEGTYQVLLMDEKSAEDYPELYAAIQKNAEGIMGKFDEENIEELTGYAKENYEDSVKEGYTFVGPYTHTEELQIKRSDDVVISTDKINYDFAGGPHGNFYDETVTYDVESGKELTLSDVLVVSEEELNKILKEKLIEQQEDEEQYYDLDEALSHYKFEATDSFGEDMRYTWFLAYDGLHVIFNTYEIAAYVSGASEVILDYNEYKDIFDVRYVLTDAKGYIEKISLPFVPDNYEMPDNLTYFKYGTDKFEGWGSPITLVVNGKEASVDADIELTDNVPNMYKLVSNDGKEFVYFECYGMDMDYVMHVFETTGREPKYVDSFYGMYYEKNFGNYYFGQAAFTDINALHVAEGFSIFGCFEADKTYTLGENGMPVEVSDIYTIRHISDEIKTKKEVKGDIVDKDGEVLSKDETIAADEKVSPIKTDGKSYVDCQLEDGRIVRFYVSGDGSSAEIDGDVVDNLFDGLQYYG